MSEPSVSVLVNKLILGTLTEEESRLIYEKIESDRELAATIRKNYIVDYLLDLSQKVEPSWDELVAMERAAKPISQMTAQELAEYKAAAKALDQQNDSNQSDSNQEPFDPFAVLRELEAREERARIVPKREPHQWTISDFFFIASIIVAILLGVGIYEQMKWEANRSTPGGLDPESPALARVMELVNPVWTSGTKEFNRGQGLGSEKISLVSGLASLTFADGAKVILEGPGELTVTGTNDMFLASGKVSATVPRKAVGFTVATPHASVIDRGTEFFLNSTHDTIEVATVLGQIDLKTSNEMFPLYKGQQATFDGESVRQPKTWLGDLFIQEEQFSNRLHEYITDLRTRKKTQDTKLDTDPNLIARFDVMDQPRGNIQNQANGALESIPAILLTGCSRQEGRWPGTYAVCFDDRDSYGEFTIQKSYTSMTFQASVQLNELQNQGNTLLSSQDFTHKPGSVYWQVTREGEMMFYITTEDSKNDAFKSRPIFVKRDFGGWFELKVVVDGEKRMISQFVDGHLVDRRRWDNPIPLCPGKMILGNTLENIYRVNDRYWDGAMDELTIFGY